MCPREVRKLVDMTQERPERFRKASHWPERGAWEGKSVPSRGQNCSLGTQKTTEGVEAESVNGDWVHWPITCGELSI